MLYFGFTAVNVRDKRDEIKDMSVCACLGCMTGRKETGNESKGERRTLKVEVPYSLVAFTVSGGTFVMFDINSSRKWQLCSRWVVFMITCTNWMQTEDKTHVEFKHFILKICNYIQTRNVKRLISFL